MECGGSPPLRRSDARTEPIEVMAVQLEKEQ